MKYATAIMPLARKAETRVSNPMAIRSPQMSSIQPPTVINMSGGVGGLPRLGKPTENFLRAMAGEQQPDEQTHDAINRISETIQRVHGRKAVSPVALSRFYQDASCPIVILSEALRSRRTS